MRVEEFISLQKELWDEQIKESKKEKPYTFAGYLVETKKEEEIYISKIWVEKDKLENAIKYGLEPGKGIRVNTYHLGFIIEADPESSYIMVGFDKKFLIKEGEKVKIEICPLTL